MKFKKLTGSGLAVLFVSRKLNSHRLYSFKKIMANPVVEMMRAFKGQLIENSPSKLSNWLKGVLIDCDEGSFTVEFCVREEWTNPAGILHGGIAAAIIDDTIGAAVFSLGREDFFTSIGLQVDFLKRAKPGDKITAKATMVRVGRTVIHAKCSIENKNGDLIATGHSQLVKTTL